MKYMAAVVAVWWGAFTNQAFAANTIDLSKVQSEQGYAFISSQDFGTAGDTSVSPNVSILRVFENGKELGPAHSSHVDIRTYGKGRFSHWKDSSGFSTLRFSTSDNTNPKTNGRTYTYMVGYGNPVDLSKVQSEQGYAFISSQNFGIGGDTSATPTASTLRIFENGKELSPAHALHADIRNYGKGRYSHWKDSSGVSTLRFSSSDNTNPKTNGRNYTYTVGTTTASPSPTATPKPATPTPTATPVASPTPIGGVAYYFSSSLGDDSRTATQAQNSLTPWKTLAKLNSVFSILKAGDSVLLKRGDEFPGSIDVTKSGSSTAPITIGAYGTGNKPVITGFTNITTWTSLGNGVYEATNPAFGANVNMVTLNGGFQAMGRYPKLGTANGGYLKVDSHSGTTVINSTGLSGIPNFVGGEIVWRPYHWVLWRGGVTAQSSGSVTYSPYASTSGGSAYPAADKAGFFFQNHINTLTAPNTKVGEWAYVSSSKKLQMYFGGNAPNTYVVKASTTNNLITMSGQHYINLDSLAILGANVEAINLLSSDNVKITSCDITFSGHDAIMANSSVNHVSLLNSTINYSNFNGIVASSSTDWMISGSSIYNTATVAGMGGIGEGQYFAIRDIGNNSTIKGNSVVNTGYVAINFRGTNCLIQNNLVDTFATVKDDSGGIYFGGQNFSGTKVLSNIVLNGIGATLGTPDNDNRAEGIYADDGTSGVEIAYNTVAHTSHGGLVSHGANNLNVHNNVVFDTSLGFMYYNDINKISALNVQNNQFVAKTASQYVTSASGGNTAINTWFAAADYNVYCRPLNDAADFRLGVGTWSFPSLSGWLAATGKEAHSKACPMTVTDATRIRFEFNASSSAKTIALDANYVGMDGAIRSGSITLQPFTSVVLIKN